MDPYANPDQQADSTVQAMITRLEERGHHPVFARMIDQYVNDIPADRPLTVLDLGCGTGVVVRCMEQRLHPAAVLHGADISQRLLEAACRFSPGSRVHWDHLAGTQLPYADATFDFITMHTLLSHVPDVDAMLQEVMRVLKPDARLIVFDADHASTTYGLPEYAKMREIDHKLTSAIATRPDICRQLPRLLKSAGFRLLHHRSGILSECGTGDFWLSSVRGFARLIPALGILSPEEGQAWVDHMMQSHDDGTFFAAGAFYTFYAVKPPKTTASKVAAAKT
jgi:ubiquinone/menaquinone biosynthesis C-methylase UbiE